MWPADSVDRALEVAYNESRYRSGAYNGWCCYGVFQINASAHASRLRARGLSTADLYDAKVNIEIAVEIFQESGWGPWGG
jgi:soluble lytic murein transglycosylase-like protein